MYDVAIIGGGVIGASIFRELTKYHLKIVILEKENDVAMGTSKANSAIIHAGYDPKAGTLMSEYNIKGNRMIEDICRELNVPFKRNGSLILAFDDKDMNTIKKLYENGRKANVKGLRILTSKEVLNMEPYVNKDIKGALYAPSGGIIDPFGYTIALAENGVDNGGEIKLNKEVISIEKKENFIIKTKDNEIIESVFVINAAGVYSDEIHNMICEKSFEIKPRLGEYFIFEKCQGSLFKHTIFQCPSEKGKGILVTPTVHGNLLVGPDAIDVSDKDDTGTTREGLDMVKETALLSSDKVDFKKVIKNFAGLRAISSTGDFIIEENEKVKNFIDVAGIMSPGLTASPAIALKVIDILKECKLKFIEKKDFNPIRKCINFMDLSYEEKNKLIKKDERYGKIICRCECISEGEIVDAIKRSFGVLSLDGIKRRCRPGMGKCQGGFCGPKVHEIIAREYNLPMENIFMDKEGSYILTGKNK